MDKAEVVQATRTGERITQARVLLLSGRAKTWEFGWCFDYDDRDEVIAGVEQSATNDPALQRALLREYPFLPREMQKCLDSKQSL